MGGDLPESLVRTHLLGCLMEDSVHGPGYLVSKGLCPRLNVIFDVDHTLIFAFEKQLSHLVPGTLPQTHKLSLHANRLEMCLVTRQGIH